jgi:hypothetical protein
LWMLLSCSCEMEMWRRLEDFWVEVEYGILVRITESDHIP